MPSRGAEHRVDGTSASAVRPTTPFLRCARLPACPEGETAVSTHLEIDLMIPQLEEMLPEWAAFYLEQQFMRMLAEALDYIAASADPEARLYWVMRTGHLHLCSGDSVAGGPWRPWPFATGLPAPIARDSVSFFRCRPTGPCGVV